MSDDIGTLSINPRMGTSAYLITRLLSRRCGACGWRQFVPRAKRRDDVICERLGDTIEWEVPAGLKRFKVEEIVYQPEAAGDYHR